MIDTITKGRITVDGVPLTGAHIIVPLEQLPLVTDALTRGGVKFWVDEEHYVTRRGNTFTWISLSRSSDGDAVQRILDEI